MSNTSTQKFSGYSILAYSVLGSLLAFTLQSSLAFASENQNATQLPTKELKDINVRLAPIAITKGVFGAHADFGLSDRITLGPTLSHTTASIGINDTKTELSAWEMGARANFHLSNDRFKDGWVFGPYMSYVPAQLSYIENGEEQASIGLSGLGAGGLMSYQWYWNSGINVTLGGGLAYYGLGGEAKAKAKSGSEVALSTPVMSGVIPNIELTLGYVF